MQKTAVHSGSEFTDTAAGLVQQSRCLEKGIERVKKRKEKTDQ